MVPTHVQLSPPSLARVAPAGTASSTQAELPPPEPLELTTCDNAPLVEPLLLASPPYAAVMLCVPAFKLEVLHVAVRVLPLPLNVAVLHPLIEEPPSRKFTLPLGALPLTVAVKVTMAPWVDGVCDVAAPVVLDALLTVCDSVALAELALVASPL